MEVSDYLRVLYARLGVQHCHLCGQAVRGQSAQRIAHDLEQLPRGTRILLLVRLLQNRKGEHRELLEQCRRDGLVRLRVDGEVMRTDGLEALDKRRKHDVEAVLDRLEIGKTDSRRLNDSVEAALRRGKGTLLVLRQDTDELLVFSQHLSCGSCGISFPEL